MNRLIFLLEERSMKAFLDGFLPRVFPGLDFLCVPHEGKNDLENSIPRKLKAWREPGVRFVVIRDNDNGQCRDLKSRLVELCESSGRKDTLVRIACQELEAWCFGEPDALAEAFERETLRAIGKRARFRNPDTIVSPSRELHKLVPEFQKVSGARRMAEHLACENNQSPSFNAMLAGVKKLVAEIRTDTEGVN